MAEPHAADCDCLACDPDPVLDSPLAAPDDWATVRQALLFDLRLAKDPALAALARLRAADQAKEEETT